MDYIVMDLEWNQNPYGKSHCHTDLTFEIIEIGAVRVSDEKDHCGFFSTGHKAQSFQETSL